MQIKDQIRDGMEALGISPKELGRRMNPVVTAQTVRCWINGRNFPNRKMTPEIERELSIKLDWSDCATKHTNTVSDSIQKSATDAMAAINKLPVSVQMLFHKLVEAYEQNHSELDQEKNLQVSRRWKRSKPKAKQHRHDNGRSSSGVAQANAVRVPARQPTSWSD